MHSTNSTATSRTISPKVILLRVSMDQIPCYTALIREFNKYKWKEDQAGKATNEPIDKFNHGIDAVRYVCLAKVMVNRKRMVKVGRV